MKKITLMMFALAATFTIQAQLTQDTSNTVFSNNTSNGPEVETVLTQNTDTNMLGTGVTCPDSDNFFFRAYEMGANGVTGNVSVKAVEFYISNMGQDRELTVYAWDFVGFPSGFDINDLPTPLAIGYVNVEANDVGQRLRVEFDTPGIANEDSNIVIAINSPAGFGDFYVATTFAETKTAYLAADNCGITMPSPPADEGFPDSKYLIDLVIDDALSVDNVWTSNVSVYPNPSSNVFNISLPSNVEVLNSSLVDILGKTTGVVYNNGQMNVSSLAPGVYFMNLETNLGAYNQKVVVKQ